jgi:hypothetical protein
MGALELLLLAWTCPAIPSLLYSAPPTIFSEPSRLPSAAYPSATTSPSTGLPANSAPRQHTIASTASPPSPLHIPVPAAHIPVVTVSASAVTLSRAHISSTPACQGVTAQPNDSACPAAAAPPAFPASSFPPELEDDEYDVQVGRRASTGLSWSEYYVVLNGLYGTGGPTRSPTMARVYADVNAQMPRAYWDYDSVNISWGALENYEVVKKIG